MKLSIKKSLGHKLFGKQTLELNFEGQKAVMPEVGRMSVKNFLEAGEVSLDKLFELLNVEVVIRNVNVVN